MSDRRWTQEQAAAITAREDILLTANAGTGKTTTVVGKILWALGLNVGDGPGGPIAVCPDPLDLGQIVAITFTEKAAYDLKSKLRNELAGQSGGESLRWRLDEAYVGTIHGYCATLLRDHALRLGIDPTFRILDEREARAHQEDVIRDVVLEALGARDAAAELLARRFRLRGSKFQDGIVDLVRQMLRDLRWHGDSYEQWVTGGRLDPRRLKEACDAWTDGADDHSSALVEALHELACEVLVRWEAFQLAENVRDFDALILDVRSLLHGPDAVAALGEIRRRCRLLIIDEFQDTDFAQRDLAFAIAGQEQGPQLFLVGDPKQSIYRFRGADISVWGSVEEEMASRGRGLSLTQSFRSTPKVIELVNDVVSKAMGAAATELRSAGLAGAVDYMDLVAHRDDGGVGATGVIQISGGRAEEKRLEEGSRCSAFIQDLVGSEPVIDPDTGERRPCRCGDIAILYRASTDVELVAHGLRQAGIPFKMAGAPHLERRIEVLDQVNLIRLLLNPSDDLRAFGYLRSPFVGLRDDVIARMRLLGRGRPLLKQARDLLASNDWTPAEPPGLELVERAALERGLRAFDRGRRLLTRRPLDEIVQEVLEWTGYREHRVLLHGHEEALSNIHGFLRMLETYRGMSAGQFLDMWDRWASEDVGIPQAALHSVDDDVVTLSTIHAAKGLEWPVVILIKGESRATREPSNKLVLDRMLGPIVVPKRDGRGDRGHRIVQREQCEDVAEETRLFYVALTRARDRLLVLDYNKAGNPSYCKWLRECGRPNILAHIKPKGSGTVTSVLPELGWIVRVEQGEAPEAALPIEHPPGRWVTSATEKMTEARDPESWERKYRHGVLASWEFARSEKSGEGVPSLVRGTIIHGVLERIEEEAELAAILDETIGSLDDPDVEATLGQGTRYREALEAEIRGVIGGEEWARYTDGEHHRELPFVHLAGAREWRVGAFDLYNGSGAEALVVDFKTHQVGSTAEAESVAEEYAVQVELYREAARVRGVAEVRLHFTALDPGLS